MSAVLRTEVIIAVCDACASLLLKKLYMKVQLPHSLSIHFYYFWSFSKQGQSCFWEQVLGNLFVILFGREQRLVVTW